MPGSRLLASQDRPEVDPEAEDAWATWRLRRVADAKTNLPFWFHPEARFEALAVHDCYAEISNAIGEAFEAGLENARLAIAGNQNAWASYLHGTQRYLMRRFPDLVVFCLADEQVEIIAATHGHQRPGDWADRVDQS